MRPLKLFAAACLLVLLSGCISNLPPEDIKGWKAEGQEAMSFVRLGAYLDGKKVSGLDYCHLFFWHEDIKAELQAKYTHSNWIVIKSPPGKIYLSSVQCMQYKVVYNKMRTHEFTSPQPYFIAKPGAINYLGDIDFNYSPQGFASADMWNLVFTLPLVSSDDPGLIEIRESDNFDDAKAEFAAKYPRASGKYEFRKSPIIFPKKHP